MDAAAAGNEAAPQAAGEQLNIKVKAQDGSEIFFKIKKSTQLKKLMEAYCQRQGLSNNQCRFIFDGERIKDDDTPQTLEMDNGDEIDVMVEQTGGCVWTVSHFNPLFWWEPLLLEPKMRVALIQLAFLSTKAHLSLIENLDHLKQINFFLLLFHITSLIYLT